MGQRQRRRLREAAAASSAGALLRSDGDEDETDAKRKKKPAEAVRESTAPPPPGVREADPHSEAEEAQSDTPVKECGTCKMFDGGYGFGSCWGYGNFPVNEDWVCDSWSLAPDWKEQNAMADGIQPFLESAVADTILGIREADGGDEKACPTCDGKGKILGGSRDCPDCGGTGKVPASKAREAAARIHVMIEAATDSTVAKMVERDFSEDKHKELADKGHALPDGSFPIETKGDLDNAISAYGRAKDQAAAKAHIIKRAQALDATDVLPDGWTSKSKESESMEARLGRIESMLEGLRESKPDYLNRTFDPSTVTTNSRGEKGYEITLIREGDGNQTDGNFYPGSAIREMCESGRAEGMQAFSNHPTLDEEEQRPERDVKELIGTHTDVRFMLEAGIPKAKSVFVPVTLDEHHPHYGWVTTLAEAAAKNKGPQPLVGWSLFGAAAGDEGQRPDGSTGRVVSLIMPTSGDLVTNAGAGGEFARRLMVESARRRRSYTPRKEQPVTAAEHQEKLREATKRLREAASDEDRETILAEIETLSNEPIEQTRIEAPNSIEALTESAPALVTQIREAAKAEATDDVEKLKEQIVEKDKRLAEADRFISGVANIQAIHEGIADAGVTDAEERDGFVQLAEGRGLQTKEAVQRMVEAERGFREAEVKRIRESVGIEDENPVEGIFGGAPRTVDASDKGGVSFLRESGIPMKKEPAGAAS